jgi:hypothetical protein
MAQASGECPGQVAGSTIAINKYLIISKLEIVINSMGKNEKE